MSELIMFDFEKFYDRIAEQMPNDCRLCEVGIANGDSIIYLAKKLLSLGKTFKIYGVDNMDYGKYEQMKTIYQNLIKNNVTEHIDIVPYDSITASTHFNDGYLDFLFLDSSHEYLETKESIKSWYSKLKDGAIFSGHDYYLYDGVKKVVDEIIPKTFTRTDIEDREFEPEEVLHIEDTRNHFGLFWMKKQWYIKL